MWTQVRLLLQEQSDLDLHCLSKRLQIFQQTTKAYSFFGILSLRVDKCEFSVYTVRIFMKARTFAWLKQLINSFPNCKNLISFLEKMK